MNYLRLKSVGLTNADTADIGDMYQRPRLEYEGWCTSQPCNKFTKYVMAKGKLRLATLFSTKTVVTTDQTLDNCPKCGRSLLWKPKR